MQSRLVELLKPQELDAGVRNSTSIIRVVIEAGLAFCHDKKRESAFVGDVSDLSNGILHGRGETVELEPRAVGDILRSLGLFMQRLGRAGRGILLLNETRGKIHQLARAHEVRCSEVVADGCPVCIELRPPGFERGVLTVSARERNTLRSRECEASPYR